MDKLTFAKFLALSQEQQLEEATKSVPKLKARPKKNLWFMNRGHWLNDLNFSHGGQYVLQTTEEEEATNDWYATDANSEMCYGVWQGKNGRGITFHQVRPLSSVKHPRITLKNVMQGRTF